MSDRQALSVISMFGALLAVAPAAAQPVIHVGSASGSPGQTVSFSVTLSSGGASVAGTENDVSFDPSTPVAAATAGHCSITTMLACVTDADCPVLAPPYVGNEPCVDDNAPSCSVNPTIGKEGFFGFLPSGCTPPSCSGIRAIIIAIDNLYAIPDGSTLYSCEVAIASTAAAGDHPLTISNESAGDTSQALIAGVTGTNGTIHVGPPPTEFLACDSEPHAGDDVGEFGSGTINISDVKAVFKAAQFGGPFLPTAGSARFSAMDAAPVDNPTTCGGNQSINIADVKQCFKRAQFSGQTNYTRALSDSTCTSAVAP